MTLQSRTKKTLALIVVAVLVVLVAFVAVLTVLIRNAGERLPQVAAYAHGKSITVPPLQYCNLYLEDCVNGELAKLDVPVDYPLQLSLPAEIADAPWRLVMVFEGPDGALVTEERYYAPGEVDAVTVRSAQHPPLQLNGIEIQLPSAVIDEEGLPQAHAIWAIKTA